MKGIFVGSSITDLKSHFLATAEYFKAHDSSFEAVFVSVEVSSYVVPSMEEDAIKAILGAGIKLERFTSFNRKKIRKMIISQKPDYMFTAAMNVYNHIWDCICKENKIPIYYYPHGFQIDNLYYNKTSLWSKLKKVSKYTYGLYNVAKLLHKPFIRLYKSYLGYISKGADMRGSELDDPRLYPDVAFVTSDYYKIFFERKYGIKNIRYEYIMPYDFTMVEDIIAKPEEPSAVCYITQTLVEDARYSKEDFMELLTGLRRVAEVVDKFYIKLHPRVASTMYDEAFKGLDNVVITREFPHCKCYFTHYSAMAYTSALVSGNTIIYEIPNQPTHEVFKEVATEIVHDIPGLISSIVKLLKKPEKTFEERKRIISKYANYTGISPYEILYKTIYQQR